MTIRAAGVCSFILLLSACGGGNSGTSGSTTGAPNGTTTGEVRGTKGAGAHCSADSQCASGVCGGDGSGNCCAAACLVGDAGCGVTACDATGACLYPDNTVACGSPACSSSQLTKNSCDGSGACVARQGEACPGNLTCKDAASCFSTCTTTSDCLSGFYCNAGTCNALKTSGACTANDACVSGICGTSGSGNCCTAACGATADPACSATDCDSSSGACVYASTAFCAGTCSGNTLNAGACGPTGACGAPTDVTCPKSLMCNTAGTGCLTSCSKLSDCTTGFYCNAGACAAIQDTGPCTTKDACTSGICGVTGTGHCCAAKCSTDDPICGATDCNSSGACMFPSSKTTCADGGQSCSGGTETDPPSCDGAGSCQSATTVACSPFICGANACLVKCNDASACVSGGFCDNDANGKNATCCSGLVTGGTIEVDSNKGNDGTACCGFGGAGPCKTVSHAMVLINAAKATGVTIAASVKGAGGNWGAEPKYPVLLGWGAELSAPGVYFYDANPVAQNFAIFEIGTFSTSDKTGYASIVGSAGNPVGIGMNVANNVQTTAVAAIVVDPNNTLYLADAVANTSADDFYTTGNANAALLVQAEGTLVVGEDQSGTTVGTVTIGNAAGNETSDGCIGLYCNTDLDAGTGCTVNDVAIPDGGSSLVVQGQEVEDIVVNDFGSVTLSSNPIIGLTPSKTGFGNCPAKVDGKSSNQGAGILVQGGSRFKMSGGSVQCVPGFAVIGQLNPNSDTGSPKVALDGVTIQNNDIGISSFGGSVKAINTTIQFNWVGVNQESDSLGNNGTIDLSAGGNTIVCSSDTEASGFTTFPGVGAYNFSTVSLDADNVAWDTAGPDYFDCDNTGTICTCNQSTCAVAPGGDGMDAVEDSTNLGGISVKSPTLSPISCN